MLTVAQRTVTHTLQKMVFFVACTLQTKMLNNLSFSATMCKLIANAGCFIKLFSGNVLKAFDRECACTVCLKTNIYRSPMKFAGRLDTMTDFVFPLAAVL